MPATMSPEKWEKKLDNMPCMICQKVEDSDENQMLLCDECNRGYHALCLNPPLTSIPKEEWYCPECLDKVCAKETHVEKEKEEKPELPPPMTIEEIKDIVKVVSKEVENLESEYNELLQKVKGKTSEEDEIGRAHV